MHRSGKDRYIVFMSSIKQAILRVGLKLSRALIAPVVREQLADVRAEVLAHHYLSPLSRRFLPGTTASMRPSIVMAVLNDICINGRVDIVECGGGISTLYIARLLAERGGRLTTIEDDERWCEQLRTQLACEGLTETTRIICAPLKSTRLSLAGDPWYDMNILDDHFGNSKAIDLILVDGQTVGIIRYPAVPYFAAKLAKEHAIVVDDLGRGSGKFLSKWEEQLGLKFRILGSFAIASTNPSFKVFVAPV
jgi:hypothetical protein